ncbi:Mob1/phocein [Hyaloraphidium curvatum]|nr:Mob1/phocein [Hyaloraphidium curvatum]
MNIFGLSGSKTFKAKGRKHASHDARSHRLKQHAEDMLGGASLKLAVQLPEGESADEWIAVNIVDFFNQIHLVYGTITEFCTPTECPIMNAGPKYEYLWSDNHQHRKPTKVSAPLYVDHLMNWVQAQLDDESLFPSQIGGRFPPGFRPAAKKIAARLFRVYGHVYHSHFDQVVQLGVVQHLNTSFKHFLLFVREFDLVDAKEQTPLKEVIEALVGEQA